LRDLVSSCLILPKARAAWWGARVCCCGFRNSSASSQGIDAFATMSLVEVALSVGFQMQSHFTCVFKRLVGERRVPGASPTD